MATPATGARASRRAAATAARKNIEAQPSESLTVNDAVSPAEAAILDTEIDEAFGPEDVPTPKPNNDPPNAYAPTVTRVPARMQLPQAGALAMPQEDLSRQIDTGDMIIPKLRIVQAMSKSNTIYQTSRGKDGIQQGNWEHSTTHENLGEVVFFIPVDMRKSRGLFLAGQGLMCRSFDMLNGEGDPGGLCEGTYEERLTVPAEHRGCPLRLWNKETKTPPKCGMTYNFLGLVIRENEIANPDKAKPLQAALLLRSTGTKAAKEIITAMTNEGGGVWHNLVLELGVEVQTNTRGTFYVPTVDWCASTEDAGFERLHRRAASMARRLGNQNLRSTFEADDVS